MHASPYLTSGKVLEIAFERPDYFILTDNQACKLDV